MTQCRAVRPPGRLLSACIIALLTVIWGTTWAAIRISLVGIPPMTGVFLRFLIAGTVLTLYARGSGISLVARSRRERWLRLLHALLTFCISYGVVFWAEQWVPSGLAAVIFATFTLLVVIIAHFTLPGERLTRLGTIGVVVGLGGVAVIFADDFSALGGDKVIIASLVMLISPIVAAVSNISIKKWGEGIHSVSLNATAMLTAAVIMGPVAFIFERTHSFDFNLPSVLALLYMAIFGSAITFSLYFWLLQHLPAGKLSLIGYGTPIVAVTFGTLVMNEPLTLHMVIGTALVIAGVALTLRPTKRGDGRRI
ncbi:MAG: EamA family transporter [bacterium]|nr:EamA family transporter [bacterium]